MPVRMGFRAIVLIGVFFVVSIVQAQQDPGQIIMKLLRSVVLVENQTAGLFTAERGGGHGTGFIVELSNGKGIVFTNRHVIESDSLEAQEIRLHFSTDTEVPEIVPAKLVYTSSVHDFAVLEFNLSDLKRTAKTVQKVKLPNKADPKEYRFDYIRNHQQFNGVPVAAYGFPLDGKEITTFGQINGIHRDPISGPFIQTQTPINGGNSGGPLVDLRDGTILGMNTAKLVGSDVSNVGFAQPIGSLLEEYLVWKQNPASVRPHHMMALMRMIPSSLLHAEGYQQIIERAIPKYFEMFRGGILGIRSAEPGSNLKNGDLILAVNNIAVGPSIYNLQRVLQVSPKVAKVTIVRDRIVQTIDVPLEDETAFIKRSKVDFVYLSGLILRELSSFKRFITDPNLKSDVVVADILQSTETSFQGMDFPPPGSIIIGVQVDDQEFTVETLLDLKRILNAHRDAPFVKLKVLPTKLLYTQKGIMPLIDQAFGTPVLETHPKDFLVPVSEIITPIQLSLNQFAKQFSFESTEFKTRNWADFVKPFDSTLCELILKK